MKSLGLNWKSPKEPRNGSEDSSSFEHTTSESRQGSTNSRTAASLPNNQQRDAKKSIWSRRAKFRRETPSAVTV